MPAFFIPILIQQAENIFQGNTLPKSQRLSGTKAIEALFREGKGGFVYPFRYIVSTVPLAGERADGNAGFRVLFSVPKRYHKRANKRNLLKRRMRESFRQAKHNLAAVQADSGTEMRIALIYSSKEVEEYRKIKNAVTKIISQLCTGL